MSEIDYEAWAKEALANTVDEDIREMLQRATVITAKLMVRKLKGEDVSLPVGAVQAAIQNLVVAGTIGSASEGEELLKKIVSALGSIVINLGKEALGLS